MEINVTVGASTLSIRPQIDHDIYLKMRHTFRYRVEGYKFSSAYKYHGWDGYKYLFRKNQTAASGLYKAIIKYLREYGYNTNLVFKQNYPPNSRAVFVHSSEFELDDAQVKAVKKSVKLRYCVIEAPIRSGKTAILAAIINMLQQFPVCIISQDKDLVKQIQIDIEGYTQQPVGYLTEGKFVRQNVWVTSYKAIKAVYAARKKMTAKTQVRNREIHKLVKETKVLLLDECHFALTEKSRNTVNKFISIGYKIGVSGTPKPDHIRRIEVEAAIGPTIRPIDFKRLIQNRRIAQPVIYLYDMPQHWYLSHLRNYDDIYDANITQNGFRNRFIAKIVEQLRKQSKSCFVMVSRIAHAQNLRELIPDSFFVRGSIATDSRYNLYQALQNGVLPCIISTVGKVGLNLPKLDAVVNAEGMKSRVATIQKMRSLTAAKGKKVGLVIDFLDKCRYLDLHSQIRTENYSDIDGFIIKHRKVPPSYLEDAHVQ